MSSASLRLIPCHPHYVPDSGQIALARAFLATHFPLAEAITATTHAQPQFIDGGSNFGTVRCPETGQCLSLEWWQEALDQAWQGEGFGMLDTTLPTTGQPVSLNDLVYEWPVGFARFMLDIEASQHPHDLPCGWLRELGNLLHCQLRLIWRHG